MDTPALSTEIRRSKAERGTADVAGLICTARRIRSIKFVAIYEMNHFPAIAILITAASWAGFAVWLGLNPGALLPAFGVEASTPQMLTEVRAFYGGVEMAITATMIVLWRRGDLFGALLVGGLPLVGSASGRLIGLMVDGFSLTHLGFAGLEIVGAAFCLAGCLMVSRKKGASRANMYE